MTTDLEPRESLISSILETRCPVDRWFSHLLCAKRTGRALQRHLLNGAAWSTGHINNSWSTSLWDQPLPLKHFLRLSFRQAWRCLTPPCPPCLLVCRASAD
eukprot:1213629-Amphidinium_carterae.2